MLPVALASADAKASSDVGDCGLPQSFSTIEGLPAAATDITAALARCAMSRTAAPGFFGARASAARGGAASASFGGSAGADGSTDCGAAAANRSSNESNGRDGMLAGAEITGAGSGKAAAMASAADAALLTAKAGPLTTATPNFAPLSPPYPLAPKPMP